MGGAISRDSYFEAGLEVLSDLGYGGLKLAEVCNRLGVTSGSFYHYFPSWSVYTRGLVAHWLHLRTAGFDDIQRSEGEPRRRIAALVGEGLRLPHGTEAAIRTWSSLDPDVHAAQFAVDQRRFALLAEAAHDVLGNARQSEAFASWALYLLIGYEQSTLPRAAANLEWTANQLLEALDSDRFDSVPDPD